MRRIDHVLTDTVKVISEGDEIISSISRTLDPPITRIPSSMDGSASHQHKNNVPINAQGTPIDCPGNALPDRPPSDQRSEGTYDSPEELSPPMNVPTYIQTEMN